MTSPGTPTELSLADALAYAMQLHQDGALDGAGTLYERILSAVPDHADALHLLGRLRHQMGRSDEGIALIRQAIELAPDFAGFHNNLGNILSMRGELDRALAAYERAVALDDRDADLHNNLGALYKSQDRHEDARASFERAMALDARHINAHNNMGLLYAKLGDRPRAIEWYVKALELMPASGHSRKLLGTTYYSLGRIEDAAEVYRQWLVLEPHNPMARHMMAACTGQDVPDRAQDLYVEQTFDNFAASFESVLNERLEYQAPQLCGRLLGQLLPPPARQFVMLDAGVGTGLCGPLMAPWARTLAGVDLSRRMLDVAQTKGLYHDLYKAELTEFLTLSPGRWDVIVSADTLCYFGDLGAVTQAAARALRPGGCLVFTVEALPDDSAHDHRIQPHGRYAHHIRHLRAALDAAGLRLLAHEAVVLRQEGGQPVQGWLIGAGLAPA